MNYTKFILGLFFFIYFHKRKWRFSTIVDEMYVIRKNEHTNEKVEMYESRDFIERSKEKKRL